MQRSAPRRRETAGARISTWRVGAACSVRDDTTGRMRPATIADVGTAAADGNNNDDNNNDNANNNSNNSSDCGTAAAAGAARRTPAAASLIGCISLLLLPTATAASADGGTCVVRFADSGETARVPLSSLRAPVAPAGPSDDAQLDPRAAGATATSLLSVGSLCRARYTLDGQMYDAVVLGVADNGASGGSGRGRGRGSWWRRRRRRRLGRARR